MRTKEDAHDYRYFPDPDLLPVAISEAMIERIRKRLPELPQAKVTRFMQAYGLSGDDAGTLVHEPETASFFEELVEMPGVEPKQAANWIIGELFGALNKDNLAIGDAPVTPAQLGRLLGRIADGSISSTIAKQVFQVMWEEGGDPDAIIDSRGLRQVSETGAIEAVVREVIESNPEQVAQFKSGKQKVLGFLIGQVMKKTEGKANPRVVNDVFRSLLG